MKLSELTRMLEAAGIENAKAESRILFGHFSGKRRDELFFGDAESFSEELLSAAERRAQREPLQYILGSVGFYREEYDVTPACLIPRQDTEVLVDTAVGLIPEGENFLDICTGSGCVAISTLCNTKNTHATAIDISADALSVARKNAEKNGVSNRINFVMADALSERLTGEFFAVISNPPYVTEDEYASLDAEIFYEPKIAFVGGKDGLDFYRRLTELYRDSIKGGGFIAYEIGYRQADGLSEIARNNRMSCEIISDFGGNPRVALLRKTK